MSGEYHQKTSTNPDFPCRDLLDLSGAGAFHLAIRAARGLDLAHIGKKFDKAARQFGGMAAFGFREVSTYFQDVP
jgi:hypothetical protein